MSPAVEQILGTAMTLPESQRLELAEALLSASEPPSPVLAGEAWLTELQRRSNEIDSGTAVFTSWAEVKRRVRNRLEGRSGG